MKIYWKKVNYTLVLAFLVAAISACGNNNTPAPTSTPTPEPTPEPTPKTEFHYSGDKGPGFWGSLSTEFEACSSAENQSPVNITGAVADNILAPLQLSLHGIPLRIINNGHTLEQEYEEGSSLSFDGKIFNLLQFHFHTLSEHAINGQRSKVELHAVFKEESGTDLAVIAMLFNVGAENEFLGHFSGKLPRKEGDELHEENSEINLAEVLSTTGGYYTYKGSLTTPPCSPIVTWIVLKDQGELSSEQYRAFRDILGDDFRPLQSLGDRIISETL